MPKGHPLPPELRLERSRETKRLWQRKYLARNQATIKAKKKADYHANKAKHLAKHKVYYELNKERIKAQSRDYYRKNKAACLAKAKEWVKAHPEHVRIYGQRYYLTHTEIINQKTTHYAATHPEYVRQHDQRRRARKASAPIVDLSDAQWHEILTAFQYRCAYCQRRAKELTQDHITPVGPEGSHTVHNIVPACRSCNAKKQRNSPPKPVQPLLLTIAPARKPRKKE